MQPPLGCGCPSRASCVHFDDSIAFPRCSSLGKESSWFGSCALIVKRAARTYSAISRVLSSATRTMHEHQRAAVHTSISNDFSCTILRFDALTLRLAFSGAVVHDGGFVSGPFAPFVCSLPLVVFRGRRLDAGVICTLPHGHACIHYSYHRKEGRSCHESRNATRLSCFSASSATCTFFISM